MGKKKTYISVVLLWLLIILSGCQQSSWEQLQEIDNNGSANTAVANPDSKFFTVIDSSSGEKPQKVLSREVRSEQQWKFVNLFSKTLGKTLNEIVAETGYQLEYKWYDDNFERLILHDGGIDVQSLLFSGSMWKEGSYCTGVYMRAEDMCFYDLPDTYERMIVQFGEHAIWHSKNNDQNAYYLYSFDDNVEVLLFCSSDGTMLDKNVIIKMADANNFMGKWASEEDSVDTYFVLAPKLRRGTVWEDANYYQRFIGKTLEEIYVQYPDIAYREESGCYIDPQTNVYFYLSGNMSTCDSIGVPAKLLFTGLPEGAISRHDLLHYWHVPYIWHQQEGTFYVYQFEDMIIYVGSDINGAIDKDDTIAIKID